jgi:hypothetical protein
MKHYNILIKFDSIDLLSDKVLSPQKRYNIYV